MAAIVFNYNQEKATEAILYLAQNLPVHNLYRICKLLYLADKLSLKKYGRFVFGETYVAMDGGGTPSNAYDLLKSLRDSPNDDIKVEENNVIGQRKANEEYLSESDTECLDLVIREYGCNWDKMKTDSHDEAWRKAWESKGNKNSNPISVESIAEMFPGSDELQDYLLNSG